MKLIAGVGQRGLGGAVALAAVLVIGSAVAHALLENASPPVGGAVPASPPELVITFSEAVEPLFSTIEVHDANGVRVDSGKPHAAPDDARKLMLRLPRLPPGTYTVVWRVTSVDTHKTEGRFDFTVAP